MAFLQFLSGARDQEFAERRQLFLTEQGYAYEIVAAHDLQSDDADEDRDAGGREVRA